MAVLEGHSPAVAAERIRHNFVPTLVTNYKIWPAAQLCNLYFVPVRLRVLTMNMIGLGFNTYLSLMNSRGSANSHAGTVPPRPG